VQRLEVLIAVMLARERRAPADAAADGCTALAAALATLPSRPLEMIAEAVAALGVPFDMERPSGAAMNLSSPPAEVQRLGDWADRVRLLPVLMSEVLMSEQEHARLRQLRFEQEQHRRTQRDVLNSMRGGRTPSWLLDMFKAV
jgi:hypothetical protein